MTTQQARTFLDSVTGYAASGPQSSAGRPILIGTIDPYYTAGPAKVIFDGESVVSGKGYPWVGTYTPVSGDRVFLLPIGQSYLIGGSVSTSGITQYLPLALQNGWGTYDTGSSPSWSPARVTRTAGGVVKVSGMISGGTATNGTVIATLPLSFRPLVSQNFLVDSNDTAVGMTVNTDGTMVLNGGTASSAWMSIDTIIFNNDPSLLWNSASLINGWTNAGSPNPPAQYTKDAFGRLWNRGVVSNTTTPTADQTMFNVPAGFRPDYHPHVANLSGGVFGFHEFNTLGDYRWKLGSGSTSAFWIDQGVAIASGVGSWTNATYLNSWVSYDTANFPAARFWKDPDGVVHLQGIVKSGAIGTDIFVLPAGYRPKYGQMYATASLAALGRIDVRSSGTIGAIKGSSSWISLDGISFPAEA